VVQRHLLRDLRRGLPRPLLLGLGQGRPKLSARNPKGPPEQGRHHRLLHWLFRRSLLLLLPHLLYHRRPQARLLRSGGCPSRGCHARRALSRQHIFFVRKKNQKLNFCSEGNTKKNNFRDKSARE